MNEANENKLTSFFVKTAYILIYFNGIVYIGYLILFTFGMVNAPIDELSGKPLLFWEIAAVCLLGSLLALFLLHYRYEVDLVTLQHGTSALSRFIYVSLSLAVSVTLIYMFFEDILDWF